MSRDLLPPEVRDIFDEEKWALTAVHSMFLQEDLSVLAALVAAGEQKFVSDGRQHYHGQGFSDDTLRLMYRKIRKGVDKKLAERGQLLPAEAIRG